MEFIFRRILSKWWWCLSTDRGVEVLRTVIHLSHVVINIAVSSLPWIHQLIVGAEPPTHTWISYLTRLLTHWGWVMHISISKLTFIGSDNGLVPVWHQAIIWTIEGLLSITPLGTNLSEKLIGIKIFLLNEVHLKILSAKCQQFCLGVLALEVPWDIFSHFNSLAPGGF